LIACLSEINHLDEQKPIHNALWHKIINSPNPDSDEIVECPDGTPGRLILLGEEISLDDGLNGTEKWWPTAISDTVRNKLKARILHSDWVLPNVLGVCLALLSEIFTTTYISANDTGDQAAPRIRLHYHKSPISDFGIVKGSAAVTNQDRFVFYDITTKSFQKGQDPNDHYWIYFTTLKGEDVFFDGCMYTFNFSMVIADMGPYTKHGKIESAFKFAPGFFCDREIKHNTPKLMEERQRFSVLRNTDLHEAMDEAVEELIDGGPSAYKEKYSKAICDFMDKVAGRTCTEVEKDVLVRFAIGDRCIMAMNIRSEEYLHFPESPQLGIDIDPGELDRMPPRVEGDEKWWRSFKRITQKQRKGKITTSELRDALDVLLDKHPAKADPSGIRQGNA
jgi:hypothetical protein